jgi:hypothetical protein
MNEVQENWISLPMLIALTQVLTSSWILAQITTKPVREPKWPISAILAILRLGKKLAQFLRHPFRLAASIGIA